MSPVTEAGDGVRIALHIQPRAARPGFAGLHGEALRLRIAAPPVDGAANDEVLRVLAERLGIPRARLTLERGAAGRRKVVRAGGLTVAEAEARLGLGG